MPERYEYAVVYLDLDTGKIKVDEYVTSDYFGNKTYFDGENDTFIENVFSRQRIRNALAEVKVNETN